MADRKSIWKSLKKTTNSLKKKKERERWKLEWIMREKGFTYLWWEQQQRKGEGRSREREAAAAGGRGKFSDPCFLGKQTEKISVYKGMDR